MAARPGWDVICMRVVSDLELRSACKYYKIACVFLDPDHVIVASGYNGPPRNFPHCLEVGCNKDSGGHCRGAHAEMNAIVFCTGSPRQTLHNATLYTSVFPCSQCMKTLVQCGIARIVYREEYHRRTPQRDGGVQETTEDGLEIARQAGIQVEKYDSGSKTTQIIVEGRRLK